MHDDFGARFKRYEAAKRTYVADPSYERIKDMIETAKGEPSANTTQ